MKIIDNVGLPEVAEFVGKQLAPFDTSKLESFTLATFESSPWWPKCDYPERAAKGSRTFLHQYRLEAFINVGLEFPYSRKIPFERNGIKQDFGDASELLVFVAGACSFIFLRDSKQVPGRNVASHGSRFALPWLSAWRRQHGPVLGRRAAIAAMKRKKALRDHVGDGDA